jgi:hypothetical protein
MPSMERFPVYGPRGVTGWWLRRPEPIVGPDAEADIREIARHDRGLARGLMRDVMELLDSRPSMFAEPVRDPPGVGPRGMMDLRKGYVAVFWILRPPPKSPGAGPALWVERVVLRSVLEHAFAELPPDSEDDPPEQ